MTDKQPIPVVVRDLHLERDREVQRLSASVDDTEIWFQMPAQIPLAARGEAFLAPALFEAMVRNAPVQIESGISLSPKWLQRLSTIQSIFRSWNPDLHLVDIVAEPGEPEKGLEDALCCFSGGVDSSYTLACHGHEISHLLLIQGFDTWQSAEDWEENKKARARFARDTGKTILAVDSNVREFFEARRIYWGLVIGSVLAGLGATFAPRLFFIPSSWTYQDLHAYGTHPLVDPLWSTEVTRVVHHGADTGRSEKIERIAEHEELLNQLQVCWKSCSRNCGVCPKCVRTSLALHLIGKESRNLPRYSSSRQLNVLKPDGEGTLPFVEDLILACKRHGARDIQRKLLGMRKRFLLWDAAKSFGKALTGGWGQHVYRSLKPREWHTMRATLRSPRSLF